MTPSFIRFARRARARLAFVRACEWSLRAVLYAACAALLVVVAHKFLALPLPLAQAGIGLGAAVLTVGIVALFVPRVTLLEAAAAVDARAGWKERLSSALVLPGVSRPMEQALVDDVEGRLIRRKVSSFFPIRVPRELRYAPLVIAAVVAAWHLLPQFDLLGAAAAEKQKEKERQEIQSTVERLQDKKKDLEKKGETSERLKKATAKIDQLVKELQKTPPPEKKEAMAKISKLAEELQKMRNELAKPQSLAEKLQKAGKEAVDAGELGKLFKQGKFGEAAKELAKLQKAMQDGKLSPEEKEKIEKQLQKLAEKLARDKDLSELEKKIAKAMQGLQQGSEQMLDDLKQSLESLDGDLAEGQSLKDALKDLENLAEALAKGEGKCPSCGKKMDAEGG